MQLKDAIAKWRADTAGLRTTFDSRLGLVLQSALAAYEWDRAQGVVFGNADFQAGIKGLVRPRECFRGYPTCFSHNNDAGNDEQEQELRS